MPVAIRFGRRNRAHAEIIHGRSPFARIVAEIEAEIKE